MRVPGLDPGTDPRIHLEKSLLSEGDIVFTGAPSGVGHARKPNPVWMKQGDVCEIDIERVGVLRNPIAAEA